MVSLPALRMHSKRIVVTRLGVAGLAQFRLRTVITILILFGCASPVVMRHIRQGSWKLIGSVYVDGIMYDEAMQNLRPNIFVEPNLRIH
jgi:hypothetical protein